MMVQSRVTIQSGPTDWQIVQRGADGFGVISLAGHWLWTEATHAVVVSVRVLREDTGAPVNAALARVAAETRADGTWSVRLVAVPAGGLYRIETRAEAVGDPATEWGLRGDMRHHIGVGDLWVIAGQSNAVGYGRGPVMDPPVLGVHAFRHNEQWALATHPLGDSTGTCHPVNTEGSNPGHSPHLIFGRLLMTALGCPIGLIPTALGGSPLSQWEAPGGKPAPLMANMLANVRAAGGRVRGMLWYQGESDTGGEQAQTYESRFISAVSAWREALGDPALPILTVQLNRYYPAEAGADRGWSLVREAQRQVARRVPGVAVVSALDLPLSDLIHISPAGYHVLGQRLGQRALQCVYGLDVEAGSPDLQGATWHGESREVIQLTFASVTSRMANMDTLATCFAVDDDAGDLPITTVAYVGGPHVHLRLARPAQGDTWVSGCPGVNPATAPVDVARLAPMLAFFRMPVTPV